MIPDYQSPMLPVLHATASGEVCIGEALHQKWLEEDCFELVSRVGQGRGVGATGCKVPNRGKRPTARRPVGGMTCNQSC